jgi:hypothetical protein
MLDISFLLCYYNYRKRKEATKMAMTTEYLEVMGDALDELSDWEAYEADLAESDPWRD